MNTGRRHGSNDSSTLDLSVAVLIVAVVLSAACHEAMAQTPRFEQQHSPAIPTRLPDVVERPPAYLAELPTQPAVMTTPPLLVEPIIEDPQIPPQPQRPPGSRDGVFQKLKLTETWLLGGGLEAHEISTSVTFGFPLPTPKSPLLIRPSFNLHLLDGPTTPDLPAQVYDAGVQFRWIRPINERWMMDLAVMPGYYADFDTSSSEGIRITGHGIALWDWTPHTKVALGVVYLDRNDVSIVPAVGFIYSPHEDARVEATFPRPRVVWRPRGWFCDDDWLYVAGEFGGGTWAIQRAAGFEDVATYRDYRVVFGWERKPPLQLQSRVEVAYVFGRKLEYESATPDFRPDDTVMLRFGLAY